ncbi:hypothetical protein [Lederbergia citrea]|uniref:Uncharacterized protein n=1 Tax=Lederbergia citrea TaxID=2833581 RepID=A0A942Z687_9BACI|nr:hypothetical protein [Lederbergia citrea]MBS4177742.1 hypothetical protein [Lederbergia citrea]MBS4223741.1 hypothetical protein [Lederbergia citrea]
MASNMFSIECPHCGRSAVKDDYYKTDERYILCLKCGYNYTRTIKSSTANSLEYTEEEYVGYGVFILVHRDGSSKSMMLNDALTAEKLEEYKRTYMDDHVDQEKSYLVSYENGIFTILLGNPPENFHLPFKEFREKMIAKYGELEYDFMVPLG